MAKAAEETTRRCIVSGEELPKAVLVRFVVGPDSRIVPDVAEKLPGRGIWVKAEKALVQKAAEKGLFARSAKASVKADKALAEQVGTLLKARALDWLKLARRAGQAVGGFEKVKTALQKEDIRVLIHAAEAGDDGIEKLKRAAKTGVYHAGFFSTEELNEVFSHPNLIHVAVTAGTLAETLVKECERLAGFVEKTEL